MYDYVVNKFVSIIKVGIRKYYIKHSVLSNKSYVLEFDAAKAKAGVLMDAVAATGVLTASAALDAQQDQETNDLVCFLIQESVLVPAHLQDVEQYYSLVSAFGGKNELATNKVLFIVPSEFVRRQIEHSIAGVEIEHDFAVAEEAFGVNVCGYAMVSVVYDFFAPEVFHKLNALAMSNGVPLQISYMDGSTSYISPVFIKGDTVCYNEMEIQLESAITHRFEYLAYKRFEKESPSFPPFLMNQVLFYSLHLVCEFLISSRLRTKNRAVIFELESMRYDLVDILPLPNCPACKAQDKMVHDYL